MFITVDLYQLIGGLSQYSAKDRYGPSHTTQVEQIRSDGCNCSLSGLRSWHRRRTTNLSYVTRRNERLFCVQLQPFINFEELLVVGQVVE